MIDDDEVKKRLLPLQTELQSYGITETDVLKRLHHRQKTTLPNGEVLDPSDPALSKVSQLTRKRIGILGDTDNACNVTPLIAGCDVLVHESTLIPLQKEMSLVE